jgi:hypothetical protein
MSLKADRLLQDAGRFWEVLIGWLCALISGTFAGLLVWLLYLFAWRSLREDGVNDHDKIIALSILGALLAIAVGFSIIAFRLISRSRSQRGLMSPLLLRIWGSFFGLMSAVVLVDAIVRNRSGYFLHSCEMFTAVAMACAAFILAKRRERSEANENPICQPSAVVKESQPIHSDTHRTSGAAGPADKK